MNRRLFLVLALLGTLSAGCASPIGVRRAGPDEVYRSLTGNILASRTLSATTEQFLYRLDLAESFARKPKATLALIHEGLGGRDESYRLFALAELSFAHAEKSGDRRYCVASTAYAYAFLLPDPPEQQPPPYDPRFRLAIDLYNRSLQCGLTAADGKTVDVSPRTLEASFGKIEFTTDPDVKAYEGYDLGALVSAVDFKVRGLRNRYRRAGVGAPLIGTVTGAADSERKKWIPANARVPVTAFLRFERIRPSLRAGHVRGTLAVYEDDANTVVRIDGRDIPIERESTAALAYRLNDAPIWDFEVAGFRRGDFGLITDEEETYGLFMLQPYRKNRIPVIFVHGTASSPARWAEMSNELISDPILGPHYQFWYFMYNSGNPVAHSSMRLREALHAVIDDVDPDRTDPALQQMILVGHSQGGLLVKMMVVEGGDRFYQLVSDTPIEELEISEESTDLISRAVYFEPLPFVSRVVFIATPHHGSFVADSWIGRLGRRLVNLPGNVAHVTLELIQLDGGGAVDKMTRTSVDNMRSDNPFLLTLADSPINEHVTAHSIIPVKGDGPFEDGNDGVVEYRSAHIDGVASELVVRSGHSTQAEPATIEEVRRILYEDLQSR